MSIGFYWCSLAALDVSNRGHGVNSISFLPPGVWFTCACHTITKKEVKKNFSTPLQV